MRRRCVKALESRGCTHVLGAASIRNERPDAMDGALFVPNV